MSTVEEVDREYFPGNCTIVVDREGMLLITIKHLPYDGAQAICVCTRRSDTLLQRQLQLRRNVNGMVVATARKLCERTKN
tara:strand:- start:815 stop:1054 length:240 start_codon:yes stop_codon:yes gene_type:complete